jgi:hypothetical protein
MVRLLYLHLFSGKTIAVLKIISLISFFMIVIEGEKFDVFMFILLLIAPFNSGWEGLIYLLPITSSIWLLYSVIIWNKNRDRTGLSMLSLLSLILFVFVLEMYMRNGFRGFNLSHMLFMIITIGTLIQIYRRNRKSKNSVVNKLSDQR